jgi:sugar transferase EpsL
MITKRLFDIALVILLSPIWVPIFLLTAIAVRIALQKPIFFRQLRPGLKGRCFEIVKFRTMREACNTDEFPLSDHERTTPFGRWLRSTSLDELPEIINVLRGEMSLVVPSPLLVKYLKQYSEFQLRRHDVLPGLTGWAQINGRNALNWEKRFELDVWYVDHHSIWLDLKIICRTFLMVILRKNITPTESISMPEFRHDR